MVGEEENGEDERRAEVEEEDDVEDLSPRKIAVKKALISQEAAELLSKGAACGSLGTVYPLSLNPCVPSLTPCFDY